MVEHVKQWENYDYGWYLDESDIVEKENNFIIDRFENKYVTGGNHSDYVLIPEFLENLKHDEVSICGAFDGECIEDLEIALNSLEIKFRRIEKLII